MSGLGILQPGKPAVLGHRHAEVDFAGNPQRSRYLVDKDPRDRVAGGASNHLADDVAERVSVVPDLGARLPPQLRVGDRRAHLAPVAQVLHRRAEGDARHAGRVREHVADGDFLLAVSAELGPQLDDRGVVAELPALHEHVGQGGCRGLADREVVEGRVRGDQPARVWVRDARNDVDDLFSMVVHGNLHPTLSSGFHQLVNRCLNLFLKDAH